jgi:hypothetical protein
MSGISNWQKTKNLGTGIWNSIGGKRYFEAGISAGREDAVSTIEMAKRVVGKPGKITQEELDKIAPTYRNSLMDSIRTNKNPLNINTGIGILAGTATGLGYSYVNNDMDNYKRNMIIGGLSGGLIGHMDRTLSGAVHSQGKLTQELKSKSRFNENDFSNFVDDFLD